MKLLIEYNKIMKFFYLFFFFVYKVCQIGQNGYRFQLVSEFVNKNMKFLIRYEIFHLKTFYIQHASRGQEGMFVVPCSASLLQRRPLEKTHLPLGTINIANAGRCRSLDGRQSDCAAQSISARWFRWVVAKEFYPAAFG